MICANKEYNFEDPFDGKIPTEEEYNKYIDTLKYIHEEKMKIIKNADDYHLVSHLDFTCEYLTYKEFIEMEEERNKKQKKEELK